MPTLSFTGYKLWYTERTFWINFLRRFPLFQAYNTLFLLMRYLLCQNKVIPNFIICVICCGVCALLHYGLLYQAQMGIE